MNVVLYEPSEIRDDGTLESLDRRSVHVRTVLRAKRGARIVVGAIDGRLGLAEIVSGGTGEGDEVPLKLLPVLDRDPPPPSKVSLLLALPRPKMLRRVLQSATAMGVKRIALVGTYRVEKSYFASPALETAAIENELLLGLEQGRDTVVPKVSVHRFFKPFVEDELDAVFPGRLRVLAHTVEAEPLRGRAPPPAEASAVLAIGPEGGFTPYEASRLCEKGFWPLSLGPRALRVDTAVPFAVGQMELWLTTTGHEVERPA